MSDIDDILVIIIVILCIVCIMLLLQIYRMDNNFTRLKKTIKSKSLMRHDLINLVSPIPQLCNILQRDHNILTDKSNTVLNAIFETSEKASIYIKNIKDE